jgi:hypothetical protein
MEKATGFDKLSQGRKDKIKKEECCQKYIFYKNTA